MAEKLEYKYKAGDSYRYMQSNTIVLEDPEFGKVGGKATYEARYEVKQLNENGTWTVEFTLVPLHTEGILEHSLPQDLTAKPVLLTIDARGTLHGIRGQKSENDITPFAENASFPDEPLLPGDSWSVPGNKGKDAMEIHYTVERFETSGDATIAHIMSNAASSDEREGSRMQAQSSFTFNVTLGHQIKSTTVIETVWNTGRKLWAVVEYELTWFTRPA